MAPHFMNVLQTAEAIPTELNGCLEAFSNILSLGGMFYSENVV